MAVEERVTTLENEIKVLKNEIQNTLLNIQEHLLSTTYNDLYSYQTSNRSTVKHTELAPVPNTLDMRSVLETPPP